MVPSFLFVALISNQRNDALRKQGILPEKPPDPNDQFEEALQKAVQEAEQNRLENLNLDELAELEDDEDGEFLESYRFANDLAREFDLVDKSVCKKYGNFSLKVDLEVWSPLRNQILLKRSRKQASRHGSLSIYSKISLSIELFNADRKYNSMQTPCSCAKRLCQEIPYAQNSQDTW
jgi:hypothetical protein